MRHPLAPAGGRLYRTGDLGRIDANGEIVYLGRADDEVKIRGHRVDLGEIENVLLEDAEVESAVAALVPVAGSDQLVSYVTRRDGAAAPEDALLARLQTQVKRRLPDYMVPAYLEVLDALPTMPSGKVDRAKLPKPTGRRMLGGDGAVVAADGDMEVRLRAVWAEVLGLEPAELSVTADFFTDLGGHSLLAATAVSLMRERGVGRSPAVRDLYGHPTVRGLAAHLDARAGASVTGADAPAPRSAPQRHGSGRYGLAGVVQGGFLYALMLMLTLPVAAIYSFNDGEVSIGVLGQLTLAATAVYLGVRWALAPLMVRLLSTDVQPGRYRLWGRVYVQLWAADLALALAPLPVLSGSPLLPAYLRMLGARVGRDSHIGTSAISLPSLVRIGDGASIGYGVHVRPWVVEDGYVVVAPVVVGDGAFVGAGSVLEPGSQVGDGAMLGEQSTAGRGQVIGAGERWAGSPSAPSDRIDPVLRQMAAAPRQPGWTRAQYTGVVGGLALLEFLSILMLAPSVSFVWWALLAINQAAGLIAAALVGTGVRGDGLRGSGRRPRRRAPAHARGRAPCPLGARHPQVDRGQAPRDEPDGHQLALRHALHRRVAADPGGEGGPRSRGLHGVTPRSRSPDPGAGELRRRHGRGRQRDLPQRVCRLLAHGGRVASVRGQCRAGAVRHPARRRLPGGGADRAPAGRCPGRHLVAGLAGDQPSHPPVER